MTGAEQPSLLERMQLLQAQSAALQDQLRQTQKDVERELAQYVPPNPVNVTVSLSDTGFPAGLEVVGPEQDRTAAIYASAITTAFQLSQATGPALPIEASTAIIDAITSGQELPATTISDDFGQFSVTASFGSVRGVELKDQWVQSCTDQLIAEEILRVAQHAAKASDAFHRFE
ncbi:hypothetical protein [uncultured Microbacterium sp.]|uniref:hypothetical protein n=1 Tax=uncultured Microbacterium sp. TaxID=191216 RepID=UPI0028D760EF|nr:hypothetical protein [uncultured Microbacterium sp.]